MEAVQTTSNVFPSFEAACNYVEHLHEEISRLVQRQAFIGAKLQNDFCDAFSDYAQEMWTVSQELKWCNALLNGQIDGTFTYDNFLTWTRVYLSEPLNVNPSSSNALYNMQMSWKYVALMRFQNKVIRMYEIACFGSSDAIQ
jgi:hypothetical protein